jgi:predicted AlkP superfamily pyrophosphatase or phosphodiesterase
LILAEKTAFDPKSGMNQKWKRTAVLNVVGLSKSVLGHNMPFLKALADRSGLVVVEPALPAVTCSSQADYLTGKTASAHGIVGNGWYFKDECEIKFWRQSNKLVQALKIWDYCKQEDPDFTVANLFWWYNMYSSADYSVTPRPQYPADGRKIPDCYTQPPELRDKLQAKLGQFPLFSFWGPNTSIKSSQWIADAARFVEEWHTPTLSLIYLPHLDYCLQKYGPLAPEIAADLQATDKLVEQLVQFFEKRDVQVIILSEYGINPVSQPLHLNQIFRQKGWLTIREESGRELLDAGASQVFAVADHQVAHVYLNNKALMKDVALLLKGIPEIDQVLDIFQQQEKSIYHAERSGDFLAIAKPEAWFTYYYWFDDLRAPDFATTVDIHKKPGYDPVELFLNPNIKFPILKIGSILARRKLGFRALMDVIPLNASLVKGSHGSPFVDEAYKPVCMFPNHVHIPTNNRISSTQVFSAIMASLKNS